MSAVILHLFHFDLYQSYVNNYYSGFAKFKIKIKFNL